MSGSTAADIERDRQVMETWEIQVPGGCRIQKFDQRRGEYVLVHLHGTKGPKRATISRDDRIYNEEMIRPDYKKEHNPFTNGTLARVVDGKLEGITDDDLREMLSVRGDDFASLVASIENELTARRLLELASHDGTMDQVNALREHIDDHWRVGGTQPTVAELFAEATEGGERLS